ncbi:centromere protein I-like [Aricia agestis]|uniref:centromere protein I-like n=1 Tax=Aricia agestis TaxID=91739 RepID=UPI001C209C0D|nr:centromere protein I-like [Aricia agestis]
MTDVGEIIDYIKSLKKGFDKDLFQSKIDELGYLADSRDISYEEFHTLFKIWLNLNIPITKWVNLGTCLVPQQKISQVTIDYSFRWILANYRKQDYVSRLGFLLDWLTAAMDCNAIDINRLDSGYELFYVMLTYESLTGNVIKLIYTLTKPSDVTRKRVLEIIEYAKNREGNKNLYKQLQVLLGLFKSYKPECVPEHIPAISIHTAFKKINPVLVERFMNIQNNQNILKSERLCWVNPINNSRNNKSEPLVPNMEFLKIGAMQYDSKMPKKNYLDFSDPMSLLQYSLNREMTRPARLRALLCNEVGVVLLAVSSDNDHAFLSHDLHHLLTNCFLNVSSHSYAEKHVMLQRLVTLQSTFMQGLPVVTRFLAQFLPFWNESDYFAEILELVQWVNVDDAAHVQVILDSLSTVYHHSQPMEQCAILKSITTMFTNLVYNSTRKRLHFSGVEFTDENLSGILYIVASSISDLCSKALQTSPGDMRVVHSCTAVMLRVASRGVSGRGAATACTRVPVPPLSLALPLLAPAATVFDSVVALILSYKEIIKTIRINKWLSKEEYVHQIRVMKAFTTDIVSCWDEEFLRNRRAGLVFSKLHPQLVSKLETVVPDADSTLSVRNHLAFAPYTYVPLDGIDGDADNSLLFNTIIRKKFTNISSFVDEVMPEMS